MGLLLERLYLIIALVPLLGIQSFPSPLQPIMSRLDVSGVSTLTAEDHELYLKRLRLDSSAVKSPTFQALATITEAHVGLIPFENLSQHGAKSYPQTLQIPITADKILRRNRGGFCFELNGLLGEWLVALGYGVKRVPAIVHTDNGFRGEPTHMILLVTTNDGTEWFVDVGFGEPSIHPLKYDCLGTPQTTPEGMTSRFITCPEDDTNVILEWEKPNSWSPRLKWKKSDARNGKPLIEFAANLELVQVPTSIFSLKMITCLINRHEKRTLSGTKYKITKPRFGEASQVTVNRLSSDEEARSILWRDFDIPMKETEVLKTAISDNSDDALFAEL